MAYFSSLLSEEDASSSLRTFLALRASDWKRISDKRTKNQAKTDKTEHGMEKRGKAKVKSKQKSTKVKVKVNPVKVNSQRRSRK
ncbi:hypothetical protein Tco_1432943 [Tanacetum coccineum]